MEVALEKILLEPKLSYLLMQTLSGGSATRIPAPSTVQDPAKRKREHEARMAEQQAAKKAKVAAATKPNPKSAAKTQGKGAGKKGVKPPLALAGKATITTDGKHLCFGFNLGTCDLCAEGDKCPKGWHLCMEPGCFKPHSVQAHMHHS